MSPFTAELIGTAMLILLGNGVVCNVVLAKTKGNGAGWLMIAAGWGMAVFVGAFCAATVSGAHLNPAVSIAMLVVGKMEPAQAAQFIVAQLLGASLGAVLVYGFYRAHFEVTEDPDAKLACFATGPAIRNLPQAFFCEAVGTFALLLAIFLMANPSITLEQAAAGGPSAVADAEGPVLGLGAVGLLPVGILVFAIGASLGGTTGYAINPARDLGPRIVHSLLPIRGKRDSDWTYAWVPVLGPVAGAFLAALVYRTLLAG
jgi:glycerol uptake facilitator protein